MRAIVRIAVAVILILAFSADWADARRRHRHYRHHYPYADFSPEERSFSSSRDHRGRGAYRQDSVSPPAEAFEAQKARTAAELVPAGWQLQPSDPNWKGQRYVAPDGSAWFAAYATPVGTESLAAHMQAIAFGEGEEITTLRGERDWVAVSGLKADRIFYRKAALACGGKQWHHVAFEYPIGAQRGMDPYVIRAARAVDHGHSDGCQDGVTASQ